MVYQAMTESEIKTKLSGRPLNINNTRLLVTKRGEVYRKMKSNNWKKIENKVNQFKGYNVILIDKKQYMRSKLVAMAYFRLDTNKRFYITHNNGDKLDVSINNLQIVYVK
jgi:hypothetical protein